MEARRVAAAAAFEDFRRFTGAQIITATRTDWQLWALRLAAELQSLLSVCSPRLDGSVTEAAPPDGPAAGIGERRETS